MRSSETVPMRFSRWLWSWVQRQWTSITLIGTGWAVLIGAVRLEQASDELAGVALGLGAVLVVLGALHHRGLTAGGGGLQATVPPDPAGAATRRLAELERPATSDDLADDEADDGTRYLLAERLLDDFVLHPAAPLEECTVQVWLHDEDTDQLYGILAPSHPGESTFAAGQGAVGRAWAEGTYVIAEGDAVHDDTFGLTFEQQERYRDLTAAAALPITNAAGEQIGVLSLASTAPETKLATQEGFNHMVLLAEIVSRVLVDLFKWFDDGGGTIAAR